MITYEPCGGLGCCPGWAGRCCRRRRASRTPAGSTRYDYNDDGEEEEEEDDHLVLVRRVRLIVLARLAQVGLKEVLEQLLQCDHVLVLRRTF